VPEGAFRIGAVAMEPIPAVPGIHPGSIAVTVLAFTSLHAVQEIMIPTCERGESNSSSTKSNLLYVESKITVLWIWIWK